MVMSNKSITTVEVEIFGVTYPVRGDKGSEHLHQLAALVDQKMQEVAAHLKSVDRTKIAILAALNIADELVRAREGSKGGSAANEAAIAKLTGNLNEALEA